MKDQRIGTTEINKKCEIIEKNVEKGINEVSSAKFYKIVGVLFEVTKKRYYFEVLDNTEYKKGEKVIVDTVRGVEIGTIYGEPRMLEEKELFLPLKPVIKRANDEENKKYDELRKLSIEALKICKERIISHKLPMKLIESEYTFDKTKLIFYFTADGRIDFRELVKDLATIFKVRIELRQIGVRDEARMLGTIGICGKELCCRTFINKFDSVSIKIARDQGLVINPAKISGVCGRLLCCIGYEYEQYEKVLKDFPAVNQKVKTNNGDGRVVSISPLINQLFVDVENKGVLKFNLDEVKFNKKEANKLKNEKTPEDLELQELAKE